MKRHFHQHVVFALATLVPGTILWIHGAMAQDKPGGVSSTGGSRQLGITIPGPPQIPSGIGNPPYATQPGSFGASSGGMMSPGAGYQKSPADHERDLKASQLLARYGKTEDEKERAKLLEELTTVVAAQFESRQESREKELQALEEQVRKLRELQARRAKEQDQIVRDRVRQLLREVDGLGWGDNRHPAGGFGGSTGVAY